MRYRIFTKDIRTAHYLAQYLWFHRALYDFIDWDYIERTTRRKNPRINLPWRLFLPLTNGTIFVLGPISQRSDLGIHYDKYAEYTDDSCPLDVLLMVIEEIVK